MQLKIISLNLWEGGLLWENIEPFFLREQPDILCLQEVFNGDENQPLSFQSIHRLKKLYPTYYFYYSPEMHETWPHGGGDTGNAIFSKFPISQQKTTLLHRQYERIIRPEDEKDFSHYPKNMIQVVIEVNGKKLYIFDLHGVWGQDGYDSPERLDMSQKIVNEIKGKEFGVLMGDFNLKPDTQTIQNIEHYMTNVFKGELSTSFNMKHKTNPGYATAVVDMFFVSPAIKVISKSVPEDDVSDHKPLIVTIEV